MSAIRASHSWVEVGPCDYGMDLEDWREYLCERCGLRVDCDRCEPHEDPSVEQDCDLCLVLGVMDS